MNEIEILAQLMVFLEALLGRPLDKFDQQAAIFLWQNCVVKHPRRAPF